MSNKISAATMINEYMLAHPGEELGLIDVAKLMEQYANQECVDITSQLHIANTQAEFWENTSRKGVSEHATRRQLIDAINLLDDAPPGRGEWLNKVVDLRKRVLGCIEQSEFPVNDIPSSEGKPLTAEEMIKPFIEQVTEPDGTILDVIAPGRAAVISEQYADQQTAALREELDKEKAMRLSQGVYVQQLKDELEAVKKELQGMKDDYHDIDEDGNHIGYGYWKDEYFRMQESASKYMKQRDELKNEKAEFDSKIMELMIHHEKQLSEVTSERDEFKVMAETLQAERWPLIDEREAMKKEREEAVRLQNVFKGERDYKDKTVQIQVSIIDKQQAQLSEVTRQRDMWKETAEKVEEEAKEMANQRDEAVSLLENWKTQNPSVRPKYRKPNEYQAVLLRRDKFLSSLSSGETKPVSPWISVEERSPVGIKNVLVAFKHGVMEGMYINGGFIFHGDAIPNVTHWMPLPAPPESLTDKSKV